MGKIIIVGLTLNILQSILSNESFQSFWKLVEINAVFVDVSAPTLSHQRKALHRYEVGESAPEYPASVVNRYILSQSIILYWQLRIGLTKRDSKCYIQELESILIEPNQPEKVKKFYGTDFNHDLLTTQLNVLHTNSGPSLRDLKSVVPYLKTLNEVERNIFSEVISIVK